MTKPQKTLELPIGIFQIVWGCLGLAFSIWTHFLLFELAIEEEYLLREEISIFKFIIRIIFKNILPIITIIGGIALIRKKRLGWILGVITSVLNGIVVMQLFFEMPDFEEGGVIYFYLFIAISLSLFSIILILLLSNSIRKKYLPTRTT